jgi:hypothetical protein
MNDILTFGDCPKCGHSVTSVQAAPTKNGCIVNFHHGGRPQDCHQIERDEVDWRALFRAVAQVAVADGAEQ